MTASAQVSRRFQARGWVLWLTWLYVVLFSLGLLVLIVTFVFGLGVVGLEVHGPDRLTLWWVLLQVPYIGFGVGCAGLLLKDRDFAWVAVVSAWIIAVIQCIQALVQLANLRLSVPLSALVFAAYAVGLTRLLRPSRVSQARVDGGMM